jgi:uncharacterized membrane protein YgcG
VQIGVAVELRTPEDETQFQTDLRKKGVAKNKQQQSQENESSTSSSLTLDPETTCRAILDSWGVGDSKCQNGVVVYFAFESRKMHICTGKGAKEAPNNLSDSRLTMMLNDIKPLLREKDYVNAIESLLGKIRRSEGNSIDIERC